MKSMVSFSSKLYKHIIWKFPYEETHLYICREVNGNACVFASVIKEFKDYAFFYQ